MDRDRITDTELPAHWRDSNRTWTCGDGTVIPLNSLTAADRARIEQLLTDNADLVKAARRRELREQADREKWTTEQRALLDLFEGGSAAEIAENSLQMKRLRKLDHEHDLDTRINPTTQRPYRTRRGAAVMPKIHDNQ